MTHFLFREKELLLVPYVSDQALGVVQWPPFLLASKVIICFLFFMALFFVLHHVRGNVHSYFVRKFKRVDLLLTS